MSSSGSFRKKNRKKSFFWHSCCAPCSSYVLEYLRQYFDITVLYYNPNITEREEYEKRAAEQKRLIREMNEEADGDCKTVFWRKRAVTIRSVFRGGKRPGAGAGGRGTLL